MSTKVKQFIDNATSNSLLPAAGALLVNRKNESLLLKYSGTLNSQSHTPFTPSTPTTLASCSKLFTSIAALQLIEQGRLSLSDPVEKYLPIISTFQVLDAGTYRPPTSKPTIHHLLTHTSGLGYDWFSTANLQDTISSKREVAGYYSSATPAVFTAPFLAEPGSKYVYGTSTDFLGEVIQVVTGMRLIEYLAKNIFEPLELNETFAKENNRDIPMLATHIKPGDALVPLPDILAEKAEFGGGGGFLNSSMNDLGRVLAMLLNGGNDEKNGKRILKEDTVRKYVLGNCLGEADGSNIGIIENAIPQACAGGDLLDGYTGKRGISAAGLVVNLDNMDLKNGKGRKKGSAFWCGFMNVYFWIDSEEGVAGLAVTNMLPFMYGPALELFRLLEEAAYQK